MKLDIYLEAGVREYWIIDPVVMFGGELQIDMEPIAESIRAFGELK